MAYKCALLLRDLISPYILKRTKQDVASQLPHKREHVLMCNLSKAQRDAYKAYLKCAPLPALPPYSLLLCCRAVCRSDEVRLALEHRGSLFK